MATSNNILITDQAKAQGNENKEKDFNDGEKKRYFLVKDYVSKKIVSKVRKIVYNFYCRGDM